MIIIDEAHHALASTYKKLWKFYPSSKFLGVTATPIRTNGDGFQDLFDKLITSDSIKWFIKNKHLSDIRYFASHTPDVSNIKIKAGDYDETELSEVMQDKAVMADLVQSYIHVALDKKIIVFAVNRAHCAKIVEKFNNSGFPAKYIDTFTTTEERNKIVSDFRSNKFKILCNVNIFTEGFDCPDVDAVQLARPTKSLTLFMQQVGRCMRPHENKQYSIILDNAGLWKEHGLPKMERNWSLMGIDNNICPSQKEIIGIKENTRQGNNEPQESRGIELIEIGELDDIILSNTINYNNIEKNLTDKKINTMRERIEALKKKIQKFEELKKNESDEEDKKIFDGNISKFQQELFELQEKFQPQRFEQVIELIIDKCQEMIDSNDIFVDGDKDIFLKYFVEPYLKSNKAIAIQETSSLKSKNLKDVQENPALRVGQTEVHRKKQTKLIVTFSNERVIKEDKAIDTFMKTVQEFIQEFGIDKVIEITSGTSLIIRDDDSNYDLKNNYKQIPSTSFCLCSNNGNEDKKNILKKLQKCLE